MERKIFKRHLVLSVILLLSMTAFFELTDADLWIQDYFYNFKSQQWLVDKESALLQGIFYHGAKRFVVVIGIIALTLLGLSYRETRWKIHRKSLWMLVLSLIFVPSLIAGSKNITNIHCPWSIERYGSDTPYIKLFEPYPKTFNPERPGKCFPAGHPTGGFALMSLYFVFSIRKKRVMGLGFGFIMGWIMGIYQMLKGAHYMSHTLFSMIASWIVILLVYHFVFHQRSKNMSEPLP